jgi:hypothetical protein
MGFLERAIRRGVSDAVGKAIGKAIEPTVTDLTNKAANAIDQAAQNTEQQVARSSGLEGAMANLERSVQGYATEAAKNMKVCPNCNKPTTADKKFCPECGTQLPEQTVAQGAVCPSCGKQNVIGTKFCQDCGTKLPVAVQEEQMHADDHASVMSKWDKQLPQYPKWNCGGSHFEIEVYDGFTTFSVNFDGNTFRAKQAVEQYRQLLLEGGFREAGENPTIEHLYKMIDGVCYHADTEHCFEGDNDTATIYFNTGEPQGGFYYKPDKKSFGLKGLFGI